MKAAYRACLMNLVRTLSLSALSSGLADPLLDNLVQLETDGRVFLEETVCEQLVRSSWPGKEEASVSAEDSEQPIPASKSYLHKHLKQQPQLT